MKQYHPYLSVDRKHDQHFVHCVLEEMLFDNELELNFDSVIIVESDRLTVDCASQYKSGAHFDSIQRLCEKLNRPIIRVFGVPEHGKGEVDHVGEVALPRLLFVEK